MNVIKNNLFNLEENYFTAFYDLINKPSIVKVDPECYTHEIFNNFNNSRLELMIRRINDYITLAASDKILHDVELIKFTKVYINYIDFKTKPGFKVSLDVDVHYGPNSLDHKFYSLYPEDFKDKTIITEYDVLFYILRDAVHYTDRVLFNEIISIITNDFNFTSLERYVNDERVKIIVDKVNNDFKPIINPNDYDFKYLVWNDRDKFSIIVHDALKVFFGILQFMRWEELGDNSEEWYNVDYHLPSIDPYYAKDFVIGVSYNFTYTFSIDQMLKYGNINNLLTYMIFSLSKTQTLPDSLSTKIGILELLGYNDISMYDASVILSVMLGDCSGNQVVDKTEETYEPAE